jgi:DNA-binding response OmpR family regulator
MLPWDNLRGAAMRVLLIEDDEFFRVYARSVLESAGHEVVSAGGGREGLRLFRESGADLVVTDVFMPDVDGLDVLRRLAAESPGVRILAVSGGGRGGKMDMLPVATLFGAAGVLHKPFSGEELLAAVDQASGVGVRA